MSKLKKKFGRRILAYLLSGAMIMSSLTSSNMTVFASEASSDTGGKYSYEETSETDDSKADDAEEKAEADEVLGNEGSSSEEKEDVKGSSDEVAETTVEETEVKGSEETSETEISDEEQTSETESSFDAEKEEMESSLSETEEDEKSVEEYDNKEDPAVDADGFYNGLELTDADMDKPYYINFMEQPTFDGNDFEKGLFSYAKGDDGNTAAQFHDNQHGLKFYNGNKLTFKVSGDSYIFVAGDQYSDNNLDATASDSGTVTPKTSNQKTSSTSTLPYCKVGDGDTIAYKYTGTSGTVTLSPNGSGTTYIPCVCVVPHAGTWDFRNVPTSYTIQSKAGKYLGLEVGSQGKFYVRGKDTRGTSDGDLNLNLINGNAPTVKIPLSGKSKVKIVATSSANLLQVKVDDNEVVSTETTKTYKDNDTYTFTCNGANGYAGLTIKAQTYISSITVTPCKTVKVSGSLKVESAIDDECKVKFTDKNDTNTVIFGTITKNTEDNTYTYEATLYEGTYTVGLSDDSYDVTTDPAGGEISIAESDTDKTLNITAEKADLKSVSGTLKLPDGKNFDIKFISEDETDIRQAEKKDDGTYIVKLKKGTTYNIVAEGDRVKDYKISPEQIVTDNTDTAVEGKDITISEADTYAVTLEISGTDVDGKNIDETTLKDVGAKLVFENTEDNDYKYTFKIGDTSNPIKLREGEYTVKIADGGAYIFKSSVPNLNIGNAENNLNIEFEYATSWDFVTEASKDSDFPQKSSTPYNYKGLSIKFAETQTGGKGLKFYSSKYSYIEVPVKNHCKITFSTDGSENMPIKIGEEEISALEGTTKTYQYVCNGTEGSVKITMDQDSSQSGNNAAYLKDIHVTYAKKINIADSITNGTVTFKDTANQSAISGDTVKLSDIVTATPGEKAEFSAWKVTDKDGGNVSVSDNGTDNASFVMPESDVTISAEFTELGNEHNISIAAAADIQNGTAEPATGEGSITKAAANASVDLALVATAEPAENYALSKWEVTYQDADGKTQKIDVTKNAEGKYIFTMPDSDVTVKPVFAWQYQINIAAADSIENGTVTAKSQEQQYAVQGDIILIKDIAEATPANEYAFQEWKVTYHDQSGIEATASVTQNENGDDVFTMPDSNVTISAVFESVVENNFKEWLDDLADENGTVAAEAHTYQGGTVTLIGKDSTQFTKFSSAADVERDGETHSGYKAGNRHATANDIPSIPAAGDGCCVVFEAKAAGMFKMYFWSTSFLRVWDFNTESGTRNGYKDSETAADFYAFDVVPGHTYVMSTTGATNNMAYIGYQFIQNVDIEAEISLNNVDAAESALETLELTLTDAALGTEKAVVKKDTETIKLLKNHTYKITSNDGGVKAEVGGKDTFTVTSGDRITFDLYNVSNETLTGEITGTAAGTVTSLKFVNMVNDSEFQAVITGTTYSCEMKPGEYDAVVETTNGGKTYDRVSVKPGAENVNEVYVEVPDPSKARVYAPADIVELEQTGLTLRSNNGGDVTGSAGAKITVPVTGKAAVAIETYYKASYTVNGREYTNTSGSTNSNQSDEMMVEGDFDIEVTGETYFRKISVSPVTAFKRELDVPGDYDTLNEAFDAIASMENRPEGEEGRVTVNLNKDIREQTVLRAPYVTLKGNNHTIDWYYGVGTLYYSVDPSTGLYSERLGRDRYSSAEGNGQLWGGAFLVYGDHFTAENTTFKNTYNYELTNEEKTDIAGSTLSVSRLAVGADVAASAYKERSNAFYIGADQVECYNCKILSSQDTLGLNGTAGREYHVYFKDCVIGGNVDYVCGDFAAVFDNCELQWKTLSDKGNDKVGYIVAPKTKPYVFRNCKVTADKNVEGVSGYYGRTWGKNSNASFIHTETNGYIKTDGWGEMSTGEGATAVFKEYGNTSGGAPFASTGSFCPAENQTSEAVQDYIDTDTVSITATVLGGWKPSHYSYEPDRKDPENPDTPESTETPEESETAPSESAPEGSETVPSESVPEGSETTPGESVPEESETAPSESTPEESETNPSESEPERPSTSDDDKITSDVKTISLSDSERVTIKAANLVETKKPQYAVIVTCTYVNKDGETDQHQLVEGVHYRVSLANGSDGKSVGTQEIVISGTGEDTDFGRFIGKKTVSYEILSKASARNKTNIAKLKLKLNKTDVKNAAYTGKAITPRVEGLNGLDSSDYTFEYQNNVNAGKAKVIVLGTGDYYGKKELTFSIKKSDISKIEVPEASNVTIRKGAKAKTYVAEENDETSTALVYKGSAITLEDLTLAIDNVKLRWREDYTVTYKNNAKKGTATAIIKGVNNLSGTIKITYAIRMMDSDVINEALEDTANTPIRAEYSSKGARLTSISLGDNVVLKENKDYKVTYSKASRAKNIAIGDVFDVKVTGTGSYKKLFKNETVRIEVVPGSYYARDNAVVDASKLKDNKTKDTQTIINTAKITDAAGVKVKAKDVDIEIIDNATIKVTPVGTDNYEETELTCHVARKLSSVKTVGTGIVKYFDGANSVTLTREEIANTLAGVDAEDIRIMSYRNNNRIGTATVTIEGTPTSIYYGTRNIKFKIEPYKDKPQFGPEGSASEESSTEESSGSTEESSVEGSSTEESSVEGSSTEESSTEESSETEPSTEKPSENQEHTLWLVGDSTVCSFNDAYYYPRYGYGTQIENYETGYYEVKNLAMSGRSSKSYLTDEGSKPLYEQLTAGISAGDVLIIGFGHNDEKAEAERYTNPNGSYTTEGSFAKSLYDNYVKIALDAGATPIVCTPIVRRNASGTLSDSDCHITKDATGYPGGDYAKAIRDLGTAVNVPVVDLTALTKALYTELGADGTLKLHSWTSDQPGSVDNTHLNIYGAKKVAYMLAKEIQAQKIEGVSNHFWTGAEPTEADDLKSNPDYVPPVYDNDLKQSELWQDYGVFKGTVFGTVGSDMSFYSVGTDTADGAMRLKASGNKSKVASGEDGFAMYYYKVPVGKNFSISAKAKLNTIPTGADVNQVAFGLMARDDMYIDSAKGVELTSAITSDYVVAGSLGADKIGNWTNCFNRKNGKLEKGSNLAAGKIVKGGVYDLNITSNTDGYAVTFDTEGTLSGGFDYQLTAVDSQYVYVGMFVSRNADVSFTDINLIVDGETIVGDDKPAVDDKELAKYNMEGFAVAANVTGGGTTLKEGDANYYKVTNEQEFIDALNAVRSLGTEGGLKPAAEIKPAVIEIVNDLNLGCDELSKQGIDVTQKPAKTVIEKHKNQPLMHPKLKNTGVSIIKLNYFHNLTIYSKNGASIKHCGINFEGATSNIIIRNITFDEFWEWDEQTSGDYDRNDWDYINVNEQTDGLWIDHCTFYKAYDGVLDIKGDSKQEIEKQRVTISWCRFLPGSENDTFFEEQMTWLEENKSSTTYYNDLRNTQGLSEEEVKKYAYGQKKTHLFGAADGDTYASMIKVTLANNYYENSMDRLPRLRFGTVHEYNCILDSQELYTAKRSGNAWLSSHITSQGAISACGGEMLLESCYINGILNPLYSGNGKSPTGSIAAINSLWYLDNVDKTNDLKPVKNGTGSGEVLTTDADAFIAKLPYQYKPYNASTLATVVEPYAGAGKLTLTAEQWTKTQYTSASAQN